MKTFHQHLLEESLSVPDAMRILGITSSTFTPDELKTAYKRAAVANHPDKGGDVETMKKINAAHDKLKAISGTKRGSSTVDPDWFNRAREKDLQFVRRAFLKVRQAFDPKVFQKHFEDIFGEEFKLSLVTNDNKGSFSAYAEQEAQWANATKTTVITLRLTVSAAGRHNTGLGAENVDVSVGVFPEIYHNKKKIKLTKKTWSLETDYRILHNPEAIFPKAKLVSKKDSKLGKFSKKDALLALIRELGATTFDNDGFIKIPLPKVEGKEPHVLLYRTTWMGSGSYGTNGIYVNSRKVEGLAAMVLGETLENITWLIEQLKSIQKLSNIDAIKSAMVKIATRSRDVK
jgi:curved DNA-binding protein CbpA